MPVARSTPLLLALLPLCACHSSDMGKVPESIVELYDHADPAGGMELELERDGSVIGIEAEVPIDSVPAHLMNAVYAQHPNALVKGAERELAPEGPRWEVKFLSMGRTYELVFDEEGNVVESEMSLTWGEAPQAVMAAADKALPNAVPVSIEAVTSDGERMYHVKKERDGARYKIVLDENAKVVRLVREQRAEIEIPIAHGAEG